MADVAHAEPQPEFQPMSIADAVDIMPDIDALENGTPPRGDDGRFQGKEQPVQEAEAEEVKAETDDQVDEEKKKAAEGEEPAEQGSAEDDIDYIEIAAAEEGGEPERIKLEDAVASHHRVKELEQELENVQNAQPELPPTDWDDLTVQSIQKLQQYDDAIAQWEFANEVQEPNEVLLDETSDYYNPQLYFAQLRYAQNLKAQREDAKSKRAEAQKLINDRQQELNDTLWKREKAKIQEFWPEVVESPAAAIQVAKDLQANYGVPAAEFDNLRNASAYAIIKDALAYRKAQGQQAKVVKAVKAKPRLVKSSARDGTTPKQQAQNAARSRLAKSGSLADAADALGDFL